MVTTLHEGVTLQGDAEGSIVQSTKVTAKREKVLVSGMVDGKTQVVQVFEHTDTNDFEVTGKGDFTLEPGLGDDPDLDLISGGVTFIDEFMFEEKLADASQWSYKGSHYPHAA